MRNFVLAALTLCTLTTLNSGSANACDDPYAYQNRNRSYPAGYVPYPPNPYPMR